MPNEVMKSLTIGANTYDLPTKTSDLTNDSGFLTSYTETDPTVPSWAKASTKPSYTANEVGAAASSHTHGNITNSGDITANATIANGDRLVINDESASKITNSSITFGTSTTQYLANDGTWQNVPTVPTKISDLTNDSGFTVDDKTWNGVQLAKQSATSSGDNTYVPFATSISPVNMSFTPVKKTPTNNAIAKYDSSAYLYSTTPTANDNSTKVATTAYVDNAVPTKTSDLTNDSGFLTTLNVESPITYTNDTIGFDGYDVTTTTTTLCNETVTTSNQYGLISGNLVYSNFIGVDPIKVIFNGVEYICPQQMKNGQSIYGGNVDGAEIDFSQCPFVLASTGSRNTLITKDAGTYTIKIEAITDNITVSSDFAKARGYSIVENPSQILVNESTTTDSGSTYSQGAVSYFSESNDVIKVTFNGVEYICPRHKNDYNYGAQYNSSSDTYDFSEYPFCLVPFSDENCTLVNTQTAGTYTVKIESYPKVAILTDDFKQVIKSSNVMIQGVDYVTAGQAPGSSLGDYATAEGNYTTASGSESHAEGDSTVASSYSSHAEGAYTTASGSESHAEGSFTTASGNYSHAEGNQTTASGYASHAEGAYTTASGYESHAEGVYTTANHKSQHVFGEYNVLDTSTATAINRGNYVEIVGKGTADNARSNARTLDWNGNEVLAGKLTVGKGPTANMDVATKQYVDNATSSAGTVTSVRVQATSPVVSSVSTAQSATLNTTISLANGYGDTKNPYASKTKNYVLAAPSTVNGTPSFRALVADDIPSLTVSKISDFPTIHTYTAGHEIDITNDTIGFDGYDVTTTTTTLCNETVTTTDDYGIARGDLVYSDRINADLIKITFNGVEYICPRLDNSSYYCYGAEGVSGSAFSEYPFSLTSSGSYNNLFTKETGTYTIKIETITDNITVSSDFAKARGYSIVENPSQTLVNESVTTTGDIKGYGTIAYPSNLTEDTLKVTFNGIEYICPRDGFRYGAPWNELDGNDFSVYPFSLESTYTSNDGYYIYITTQTAGTYTVKIETLPKVAMLTDDFKLAVNQSFPGDVMIKGQDYVTAGQAPNGFLGSYATAEGSWTTASGEASHAEGSDTTASGNYSHAEGYSTTASGYTSHAEGYYTTASNNFSHTEGNHTTASGYESHAEGYYTTANHRSQHVFGEYNVLDTSTATANNRGNYVEIVGKGTADNARSNARTLDWNGNEILAGKLTVGKSPTANMDVATKQYVDNAIPTKTSNLTNDSDFISLTTGDGRYVRQVAGLNSIKYTTNPSGGTITLHAADTGSIDFALSADANGLRKATISTNDTTIVTFGEGNGGSAYTTINSTTTTINGVVTPTADGMAANKKYVDDSITAAISAAIGGSY